MASTVLPAARAALVTLLQARPALSGKQVVYGWPGLDLLQRECIYLGNRSPSQMGPASLRTGRTFRNEEATFEAVATVEVVGGTAQDAETAALVLGKEIEECVADNRTLGGVTGLNYAIVTALELMYQYTEDGCSGTAVYTVTLHARLT